MARRIEDHTTSGGRRLLSPSTNTRTKYCQPHRSGGVARPQPSSGHLEWKTGAVWHRPPARWADDGGQTLLLVSCPSVPTMVVGVFPPDLCGWQYLDRVVVEGLRRRHPPAMFLNPSSLVSSSVVALVACRPDARGPSQFLRCPRETAPPAIVVSPLSCRQSPPGYCACLDDRSSSLSILVVPVPLLSLSSYNRTCPDTLPTNGRVFLWSSRSPSPHRFPLASDLSTS